MTQADLANATLDTPRLHLRPLVETDAPRVAELAGKYDVAVMCARVPHPYPVLAAEGWIAMANASRRKGVEYPFAVTLPGEGLIGSAGIAISHGAWELGYWIGKPYWGAGYASEAARAVMDWTIDALGAEYMTAGHFIDNGASGRILEKLGFHYVGERPFFGLARGGKAPARRYVWPDLAAADKVDVLASCGGHG